MRRPVVVPVAVLLAALAVFAVTRPRSVPVDVLEMKPLDVQTSVVASGRVLALARVDVGATLTGRVEQVLLREGARVKAGDPLVRLERSELEAVAAQAEASVSQAQARLTSVATLALPTAQAGVQQAQANLGVAEREAVRARDLFEKKFVSQSRVDDAERQLALARSQLSSAVAQRKAQEKSGAEAQQARSALVAAEATRQAAKVRLEQATVKAPADGVVLERAVEPGDIVQPGRRLMTLVLDGPLRLSAQVDEKNLPLLKPGAKAVAAADAFPDLRFPAEVSFVAPGVDAARGTVELRLTVAEPPAVLKSDMTVSIEVPGPLLKQALVIPADAVRQLQTNAPWVVVLRDDVAVRVPVTLGVRTQGRVSVEDGLKAGDQLILTRGIEPGTRVRVR
jgi:HlyD family secretion protein